MFTDKELSGTIEVADRKIKDIMGDGGKNISDAEYIRSLQTLFQVKAAAEDKQAEYGEVG